MLRFKLFCERVTQRQIADLEKFGDKLLNKYNIDIEFSRHFADRMNDPRNKPEIKIAELQKLFKKIAKRKGKSIKQLGPDVQAVLKDIDTDLNLPIVIHCRDAFDEVYAVLLKHRDEKLRGIFHCFTGKLDQAKKIIDLGFYLGIGGVVTYKNAGLDSVVAQIHLDHLVLETDSPYLPPVPFRGKPNESSYLVHIAQKVADLHQISIEELARITTENSTKIFGI